jgi:hypothetical protein
VLLLIATFTGWYGLEVTLPFARSVTVAVPTASTDAWDAFSVLDVLLVATIVSALALACTQATRRSPAIPVSLSVITTVLAIITAVAILVRIIDPPSLQLPHPAGITDAELSAIARYVHRSVAGGAWFGLAAAVLTAVGGWMSMRTEGIAPQDEFTEIETLTLNSRP